MASSATLLYSVVTTIDGTTIGEIDDSGIPFPKGKTGTKDVTSQDSGTSTESRLARFDPGAVTIKGNYVAGDTGQLALAAAFVDRLVHVFTITIPNGTIVTFNGLVSSYQIENASSVAQFSSTIEVTGTPTMSTSTSALTTPFFIVTTSTGIIPVASASTTARVVNVATATATVTVTPTCATANARIYVTGGGLVDALVATGVASGTITLGAAATMTPVTIRVEEPNKAPGFYRLYVARA